MTDQNYKLVPVEPTEEMLHAALSAFCLPATATMESTIRAAVDAAPDMYAALKDARAIAMRMAAKADIPYCAEFGTIAQILDAALAKADGKSTPTQYHIERHTPAKLARMENRSEKVLQH